MFKKTIQNFNYIITIENIFYAWKSFSVGKNKNNDVIEFKLHLMDNIHQLHTDLKNKTYTHGSYSHFTITDPKKRDIHKSSVRDRIVHHLLYNALYPYFDTKFIHDSYSCRIGKGTHRAINRFKQFSRKCSRNNTKTCWVLKYDIRKFFASIDHEILKQILRSHINDSDTIGLLENIIDSFCTERSMHGSSFRDDPVGEPSGDSVESSAESAPQSGEEYKNANYPLALRTLPLGGGDEATKCKTNNTKNTNKKGLPLGNLTSQLLVNSYMNKFDQFVKHRLKQKYYIRYADDFVFLADSKNELEELLPRVREFLWESLRLELHPDKVFIKTIASGVDFLGWVHFTDHRVLRTATKRRLIRNLKDNPKVESIASYKGMLSYGNAWKLQEKYLNNDFCIAPSPNLGEGWGEVV
jgi:retron-type reverse transcriptase